MSLTTQDTKPVYRAYLDGVDVPNSRMPDIEQVRTEARDALVAMKEPTPKNIQGRNQHGQDIGILHPGIAYNIQFPSLFKFAYFCDTEDVPTDILPSIIWALEWYAVALQEASELQLRSCGHILPNQHGEKAIFAVYLMSLNARRKLATHTLHPDIDRPLEALRHYRAAMESDKQRAIKYNSWTDSWERNPYMYTEYAVALARSRTDDAEARKILTRIMNGCTQNKSIKNHETVHILLMSKLYLARVLRRLGADAEAAELESWLVTYFKKNPFKTSNRYLILWFSTDIDQDTDPVFTGLGGKEWLRNRTTTFKTAERQTRSCRNCSSREPAVQLFQCAGCKYIFYCTKECQKLNWPHHKEMCKERAASLKNAHELRKVDPKKAKRAEDWVKWRDSNHPANNLCLMHALGLKRDPTRSKTHIVIKLVEHVPGAQDPLDRFRVVQAGVYNIDEVRDDIETLMAFAHPGESIPFMKEMLDEFACGPGRYGNQIPFFDLMTSPNGEVETYMSTMSVSKEALARAPYDPKWRNSMNRIGAPPGPMRLISGKKDAEHIF